MPFEAKSLAPSGSDPEAVNGAFADAATGGVAVLEAPSGHVLTEGLASALTVTCGSSPAVLAWACCGFGFWVWLCAKAMPESIGWQANTPITAACIGCSFDLISL